MATRVRQELDAVLVAVFDLVMLSAYSFNEADKLQDRLTILAMSLSAPAVITT